MVMLSRYICGCFWRRTAVDRVAPYGSSRQRTATASAVASLFDGGRGQCLRTWFVRMSLLGARSEYPDCPRIFGREVRCSIYSTIATSLLRLDREALPLTISFADGVLFRKPFAKGLSQSSIRGLVCFCPLSCCRVLSGVVNNIYPAHEKILFFLSALDKLCCCYYREPCLYILL